MPTLSIEAGKTVVDVEVTIVGEDLYRLEEEPALFFGAETDEEADSYPRFGDTIRATRIDSATVRYESVHERGPYLQYAFTLSHALSTSAKLDDLLALVVADGGHWERHMVGLLFVALPKTSSLNLSDAIARLSSGA